MIPYGPVPSERQIEWHKMEFYGFLHFTVNTFTDREWGYGDEAPSVFNPTDWDADQIAETARAAGMKGLILTAKHHDGFCLWPSRYTDHSVQHSPWRQGQGDVVREVSEACRRNGLRFGVYLSPWDRHHPEYGRPTYLIYYRHQLRELLENYGPLFEVWFDGANGGDGFYGGRRERREIDPVTYYDWQHTWQIVRDIQPQACMFSDAGPDVRWVGNEKGIAGETCWATLNRQDFVPGCADTARLNRGDRPGAAWVPAECDVSIRPGWFYHAAEDEQVRSPENLFDLYMQSVGRGASLLLNLPPDRRGRIHPNDVAALQGFRRLLDQAFALDLAREATVSSLPAHSAPDFAPDRLTDGLADTFWYAGDDQLNPELVLEFEYPISPNIVGLREYLPLGQRVEAFALDAWQEGQWQQIGSGTSVGARRLIRCPHIITTQLRLRITQAAAGPALSAINVYGCRA